MKKHFIAFPIMCALFALVHLFCTGEKVASKKTKAPYQINDSIVQREIAYFTIAGLSDRDNKTLSSIKLTEVPLQKSTETYAYFDDNKFFSAKPGVGMGFSRFYIEQHKATYSDKENQVISMIDDKPCWGVSSNAPLRKVQSIGWHQGRWQGELPDSAFDGLFEPPIYLCQTKSDRKQQQNFFRVLLSEDNRRIYFYLLAGKGKDRYEVTWANDGYRYYKRFINKVPEQ